MSILLALFSFLQKLMLVLPAQLVYPVLMFISNDVLPVICAGCVMTATGVAAVLELTAHMEEPEDT